MIVAFVLFGDLFVSISMVINIWNKGSRLQLIFNDLEKSV